MESRSSEFFLNAARSCETVRDAKWIDNKRMGNILLVVGDPYLSALDVRLHLDDLDVLFDGTIVATSTEIVPPGDEPLGDWIDSLPSRSVYRFAPPQGEIETAIAHEWSVALEIPRVGRNDDFLDLGGDSLTALAISITLSDRHSLTTTALEVFEASTPRSLALALSVGGTRP